MNSQTRQQHIPPSPPEKGSFPLDHTGACNQQQLAYMQCLKKNRFDSARCKLDMRIFLQCRMDHGLMRREPMTSFGLDEIERKSEK